MAIKLGMIGERDEKRAVSFKRNSCCSCSDVMRCGVDSSGLMCGQVQRIVCYIPHLQVDGGMPVAPWRARVCGAERVL